MNKNKSFIPRGDHLRRSFIFFLLALVIGNILFVLLAMTFSALSLPETLTLLFSLAITVLAILSAYLLFYYRFTYLLVLYTPVHETVSKKKDNSRLTFTYAPIAIASIVVCIIASILRATLTSSEFMSTINATATAQSAVMLPNATSTKHVSSSSSSPVSSLPTSISTVLGNPSITIDPSYRCEDLSYVQLKVGDSAKVVWPGVNLRSEPAVTQDFDRNIIAISEEGTSLIILDGPVCAHEGTWWKVRTPEGQIGWMREHISEGYLINRNP